MDLEKHNQGPWITGATRIIDEVHEEIQWIFGVEKEGSC